MKIQAYRRGSRTVKVVPLSVVLVTEILPRWVSVMLLAMASPRP